MKNVDDINVLKSVEMNARDAMIKVLELSTPEEVEDFIA
jgi:hypothetical protein